ncbi:AraC family transcriptional regulator [Arthrobacter sp. GMC3]|uniref:helix-turn-helix transcriptional regulator n=1 Tax=Arthrobacter sp. GMC3 TaxID=2058894 RepID=UPI001C675E51|nr:AraC family transcriptional regulator [Arthrobacter sp. GMC3]
MTSVLALAPAPAPALAAESGKIGSRAEDLARVVRDPRAVPDSFLLTTGMMEQEESYQWPPHSHDEHELIWSARGVVTIIVDGRMWSVLPGIGLWIPRGVVHEGHMDGGVASRVTLFTPEAWTRGWKGITAVRVNAAVQQLLVHLARTGMPAAERLRAQQVCIDMLEPVGYGSISVPIPSDPRIRELVDSVLKDPSDDRSLEQWARRLNLSSRTITRTFGAEVAMSFTHWRRLVRMRSAHGLLSQGLSVGAVGRKVGYGTTSAFVAAFRKVVGRTPGELISAS